MMLAQNNKHQQKQKGKGYKMTLFVNRPKTEQEIIRMAYQFEIEAIEQKSLDSNPYADTIFDWADGYEIWDAIAIAVQMYFE